MQHAFGYIQDGKVFLKGFLGRPDRVIGEVKGDEASTLLYFETRFTQLKEKVAHLKAAIEENQNKGSFLMKLILPSSPFKFNCLEVELFIFKWVNDSFYSLNWVLQWKSNL